MGNFALRSVIIASLSTLLALGLFRFAYSALLPLLIAAQWFSADTALYLSAANLCGYLMGALSANPLNRRFSHTQLITIAALLGSASLLACAAPPPTDCLVCVVAHGRGHYWGMVDGVGTFIGVAPNTCCRQKHCLSPDFCRHRFWGIAVGVFTSVYAKLGLKTHMAYFGQWQLAVEPAHHCVAAQTPTNQHTIQHHQNHPDHSNQTSVCHRSVHHLGLWLFWHGLFAPCFVLGGLFGA